MHTAPAELLVLPERRSKHGTCYGNVAGWLAVTAGIVSKRLNYLKTFSTIW